MSSIRKYAGTERREEILQLIEVTYNVDAKKTAEKIFDWSYRDHPHIREDFYPFFIFEKDEGIVGNSSFIPLVLMINGKEIKGTIGKDTMVHPNHRGAGPRIFKDILNSQDLFMGIATPVATKLWEKVYKRRLDIANICLQSYPLNIGKILSQQKGIPLLKYLPSPHFLYRMASPDKFSNYTLERVETFNEEYNDFFNRIAPNYTFLLKQDAAYMNWRFNQCPTMEYLSFIARKSGKIKGFIILRKGMEKDGLLRCRAIDYLADYGDNESYAFLLRSALKYSLDNRYDLFQITTCSPNIDIEKLLDLNKLIPVKKKHLFTVIAKCDMPGMDKDFFYNKSNWHLSVSFSDQDFI